MRFKHSLKNTPINNLLFIYYNGFIVLLILAVSIVACITIDSIYIAKTDSEMNIKLSSRSNALERMINEDIELSSNICGDANLRSYLRSFANMDILSQSQTESKITQIFNGYWMGRAEITRITAFANGKKYTAAGKNAVYPLEKIRQDRSIAPYLDLPIALITDYALRLSSTGNDVSFGYDTEKMTIVTKIEDYDSSLLGHLFVEIDKQTVYQKSISEKPDSNVFVIDNKGKYLFAYDSTMYGKTLDNVAMLEKNAKNAFDKTNANIGGVSTTAFFSETNRHGWKVVDIKRHSELFYWRQYLYLFLIAFFLFAICISWVFTKGISRFLISPVTKLAETMKNFGKIDMSTARGKEIILLYRQYNILLKKQETFLEEAKRNAENIKNAEFKALVAQINPHFLYNTLNSIGYSAIDIGAHKIVSMISKLGKICHMSYDLGTTITTLSRELDHICLYMDLQAECFQGKLSYSIVMDEELEDLLIPKFILQPIIENSILHGFYQIDYEGMIKIEITRTDVLQITIHDNGKGIQNDVIEMLNSHTYKCEKYGIRNINDRIRLMYGDNDAYGIEYKSNGRSYTAAAITLPLTIPQTDLTKG